MSAEEIEQGSGVGAHFLIIDGDIQNSSNPVPLSVRNMVMKFRLSLAWLDMQIVRGKF